MNLDILTGRLTCADRTERARALHDLLVATFSPGLCSQISADVRCQIDLLMCS